MPCTPIHDEKGFVGIICTRSANKKRCTCGATADYECDYPTKENKTCNKGVCSSCALHFAGRKNEYGDGLHTPDSYDYCTRCQPFAFATPHGGRILVVNAATIKTGELIDRSTPLGNHYQPEKNTPELRLAAIEKYRRWLWMAINTDSAQAREFQRLCELAKGDELKLRCWCVPQNCHGQVLAKAIIWQLNQTES